MIAVHPYGQTYFMYTDIHECMGTAVVQVIALFVAIGGTAEDGKPHCASVEIEAVETGVGDME
jgi:hypothetical protein